MKKTYPSLLINVCLLLAGIIFISVFKTEGVIKLIINILGVMFILPSLIYLGMVAFREKERRDTTSLMGIVPAAGGLCFGVVLCLHPEMFTQALSAVFSIILIALGLFHIIDNIMVSKFYRVKFWQYIAPVLIAIAGVVTLLLNNDNQPLLILLTGISLILSAISSTITLYLEQKAVKTSKSLPTATPAENSTQE